MECGLWSISTCEKTAMPSQVFLHDFAPPPVMRAGLDTVAHLCVHARNKSLRAECEIKEMNDLMEAVHEVPQMLMNWNSRRLEEIRLHLSCFRSEWYPGAPDFVAYFDRRLEDYEHAENLPKPGEPHP